MTNPWEHPTVLVAVISATQVIILAVLGWLFKRIGTIKKDSAATKEQIVNHHPSQPNFREENDKRHNETRGWFSALFRQQAATNRRLDAHGVLLDDLTTGFLENRERIENIEDTQGKARK